MAANSSKASSPDQPSIQPQRFGLEEPDLYRLQGKYALALLHFCLDQSGYAAVELNIVFCHCSRCHGIGVNTPSPPTRFCYPCGVGLVCYVRIGRSVAVHLASCFLLFDKHPQTTNRWFRIARFDNSSHYQMEIHSEQFDETAMAIHCAVCHANIPLAHLQVMLPTTPPTKGCKCPMPAPFGRCRAAFSSHIPDFKMLTCPLQLRPNC